MKFSTLKIVCSILILAAMALIGCDNKRSSTGAREKAKAEYEIGQELERQRQRQKAEAMEADLVRRKRLYERMNAEFEGEVNVRLFDDDDRLYPVTLQLIVNPQIPPESSGRLRELTEIEADLASLKHFVHGVLEIKASRYPYVEGCDFETQQVYKTGYLYLKSESCNFFVSLYLNEGKIHTNQQEIINESSQLAEKAMNGTIDQVPYLLGRGYFSQTGESFTIQLKRKNLVGFKR